MRVRPRNRSLHSSHGSVPRAPSRVAGRRRRGPADEADEVLGDAGRAPSGERRERCASSDARHRPRSEALAGRRGSPLDPAGDPAHAPPRRPRARRATTSTRTRTPGRASGRSSGSSARAPWASRSGSRSTRAGWPVGAVASRDPGRRERFRERVPGVRAFAEPDGPRRRRRARDPRRPRRRRRAARRVASACTRARRSSTPAGCSARRCSHPALGGREPGGRVPPAGGVRRPRPGARGAATARRSRSRATTTSPRTSPTWPRRSAPSRSGSRRAPRPPTTRRPCSRPAASSRCSTSIREVAAATGLDEAGALRIYLPLLRADGRQRPGARRRARAHGPGDPRRRRDGRRAPRRARGRCAPDALPVYRALLDAIGDHRRRRVAPWHRKRPNASGPHLRPTPDAVRCGHAAQHRDPPRGVAGTVRPPVPGRGSGISASIRGARVHRRPRPPDRAAPAADVGPLTALRASWRALVVAPARPVAQRPARGPRPRCPGRARTAAEGRGARRWRRRGAPEGGHRHLSGWHRHPVRRGGAGAGRRPPQPRARRDDLDAAQGHAAQPARPPRRRPCARCARRPASTSGSSAASTASSTCSSRAGPGSTRPSTTS